MTRNSFDYLEEQGSYDEADDLETEHRERQRILAINRRQYEIERSISQKKMREERRNIIKKQKQKE